MPLSLGWGDLKAGFIEKLTLSQVWPLAWPLTVTSAGAISLGHAVSPEHPYNMAAGFPGHGLKLERSKRSAIVYLESHGDTSTTFS